MDLSILTAVNKLGSCDFSTEKLSELEVQKPYKVLTIKALNTCYGRRIVIQLKEVEGFIYLPERFKAMSDQEVEVLSGTLNLHLVYKGKKTLPNGRTANDLEFLTL